MDRSTDTVYVGGLNVETDAEELRASFVKFGKITHTYVITDPSTEKSKGYGFVTFEDPQDAANAVEETNNLTIDGRIVRVNPARPQLMRADLAAASYQHRPNSSPTRSHRDSPGRHSRSRSRSRSPSPDEDQEFHQYKIARRVREAEARLAALQRCLTAQESRAHNTLTLQAHLTTRLDAARQDLFRVDTLVRRLLKAEHKHTKAAEEVKRTESKLQRVLHDVREEHTTQFGQLAAVGGAPVVTGGGGGGSGGGGSGGDRL